jgi:hypothetical protein
VNILVVIYAKNCIRDITILNNVSPLEQHCNPGHGIEATKTIKTLDKIHLRVLFKFYNMFYIPKLSFLAR